jgi:hypothetical protein
LTGSGRGILTWTQTILSYHAVVLMLIGAQQVASKNSVSNQGCQIFLVLNKPNWEKYTKWPQTTYTTRPYIIPNGRKIFQMVKKYTNIFHSNAFQNLPKLRFWAWIKTIWQPCSNVRKDNLIQACSLKIIYERFVRTGSFILKEKPIVLFERHCHVTEKLEAIACARRCRSSR